LTGIIRSRGSVSWRGKAEVYRRLIVASWIMVGVVGVVVSCLDGMG